MLCRSEVYVDLHSPDILQGKVLLLYAQAAIRTCSSGGLFEATYISLYNKIGKYVLHNVVYKITSSILCSLLSFIAAYL